MTEAEWLKGSSLEKALIFLQGKANDRKLRLFAAASFAGARSGILHIPFEGPDRT